MDHAPITPDDPRLAALALGDIRDAAERAALESAVAADPALAAAVAEHRKIAAGLRTAFRREPLPFVNPETIASRAISEAPARRTARRSGGLGGSVERIERTGTKRFLFPALVGLAAACVALVIAGRPAETETITASAPARPGVPMHATVVTTNAAALSSRALAGMLPGLRESGAGFRPAGRASVALSAPHAREYLAAITREYAAGRRVDAGALRVDGLVNAFVSARPLAPSRRPVLVEAVLTDAPWNAEHRLLRVTVRAQGSADAVVARNAGATLDFDAAGVKRWRILGHEGRAPGATVALRGGDTVTTLYEIEPAAGDAVATVALRYSPVVGKASETVEVVVKAGDRRALAATDADTRFAAALAAFALNLGDRPAEALARAAGDDAERRSFAAIVK